MCGICGVLAATDTGTATPSGERVQRMLAALQHRGPDAVGTAQQGPAVFGATRLAIRGLRDGDQPLQDPDSGVLALCNGEIDNHAELREWLRGRGREVRQETDVAVLPGLYLELGESFVSMLSGAFAIALWDPRAARLLLVRDRAGERPLFYQEEGGEVVFATEIAAFLNDRPEALHEDRDSLIRYLRFGSFTAPATPFREIRKVAPGEVVVFEPTGKRQQRYWRWDITNTPKARPRVTAFDDVFRTVVRQQSAVDVPYGVFLSGGVDSSLVAAVARAVRPDYLLRGYTVRFGEASYDEGRYAEAVAARLGVELASVWVKPENFPVTIRELLRLAGEPLADPAWVPTALLARRAARDVKVVLVGEGGDEIFGGYPTYMGAHLSDGYTRLPSSLRRGIAGVIRRWPPSDRKVSISFLLKRFVAGAEMDGLARHFLWTASIPPPLLERLGCPVMPGPADSVPPGALLDRLQQYDLENSLAEGLLTKADRASMGSALEVRAPFLDRRVLEFAAALPAAQRVSGLRTKVFLKQYAARYLPRAIVYRRKRGLSVPLATWLREPLHGWAADRLATDRLERVGVHPEVALSLLEEHRRRSQDHARVLWTLIVLAEWLDLVDESRAGLP